VLFRSINENKETLDTTGKYAIFRGLLIFPFIYGFIRFIGALILVPITNPSEIGLFPKLLYYADFVNLFILGFAFVFMLLRKKLYPILMVLFYAMNAIFLIIYYFKGFPADIFQIFMSLVFIVYLVSSKRVKQTF